ncbi:MAG TPA: glutamine--tRNA ligase/YqeY domain fusion protein [Nannocystaceae bacterium]|nr:glutamine--tRNA ligase/YqeY domain fusion protein [Nannocystaceae bacterium]
MTTATHDPHAPERQDDGPPNFIREMVEERLRQQPGAPIVTRFPPEPNGYLHIGHAKSIVLNFGLAALTPQGRCNLRFDDTNPATEETEFVEAIQQDVIWLGYQWSGPVRYASDYFEQLYQWALQLIREGKAYVDSQSLEELRSGRGSFHMEGHESPYRGRSVEENLDLFQRMRAGEFDEGAHVLRAKIDMTSKDVKLRDPLMYRIRKAPHHRTGDAWPIYPMYDWAHGQSDAIEGITHSICTLEFQNHRPLYDWFLDAIGVQEPRPHQTEFARLNLSYTVLSKRKLQRLVRERHVAGWDDPRMPTIAGIRRRGVTPEALRAFCERIGVSRRDGVVDISLLEYHIREDLNARTRRVMGVLRPLKVVLVNLPEDFQLTVQAPLHPDDPSHGARPLTIGRTLYIEHDDFMEHPPKKFFRLAPGQEVRLRYAALIRCVDVKKDAQGAITEVHCTWDPDTIGKAPADGRKVKGTIHWVDAATAVDAEVRVYDRLFTAEDPNAVDDFLTVLNPGSLEVLRGCKLEPSLARSQPGDRFQLERLGYFCTDLDAAPGRLVVNRTITLKDTWAKIAAREG